MTSTTAAAAPLLPAPDDARRELLRELTGRDYVAAQPNWLDRLAQSFWDWLSGIRFGGVDGAPGAALLIGLVVVVGVVVVVLAVYGVPRLDRRSTSTGVLFGDDDDRSADDLRAAARTAASRGDMATATIEAFRALARSSVDRGVVSTSPGTTARSVGVQAARAYPERREALQTAARAFDGVRYLGWPGSEADYRAVVALDLALRDEPARAVA